MRVENLSVFLFVFVLCTGFVSAGFFDDIFGKITGNVILGEDYNIECEEAKTIFDEKYLNYEIPGGIPFSDDVFDVYVDDDFFASFELREKKVLGVSCESSDDVSYNVYVDSDLIDEVSDDLGVKVVDFYNEKKKSGELKIEAVGFGKKLKLGFINFGLRIIGWFS